jgi:hypothetical protein
MPKQALLSLPEMAPEAPVRPGPEHAGRAQVRVPRVPKGEASGPRSGSSAAATVGLCHPLRGSGKRRKGVAIVRHMYPFWRDDATELERIIELWIGDEE